MSQFPFIKMHGAENDFIFFDGFHSVVPSRPERLAPMICRRHANVGADGVITLTPPSDADCDVVMQIWNADGSEAGMCGNGARCGAVWMQREGRVAGRCRIRMPGRLVHAYDVDCSAAGGSATIDMGSPVMGSAAEGESLELPDGKNVVIHRVDMGNPHAVLFVDKLSDEWVHTVGPQIERHASMPAGTNVEFVERSTSHEVVARVWERGCGETRACGSGACAIAAVAFQTGRVSRDQSCSVSLPGGVLEAHWPSGSGIQLSGPVVISFTGDVTLPDSGSNRGVPFR